MKAERLSGKIAFVTGGASGIGLATARRFAEHGATVVIADRNEPAARQAAEGHPSLHAIHLDVTDEVRWAAAIDEALERFGRIDAVVNSAGIATVSDIETCTTQEWRRVMSVNADGVFFGCRNAVRAMKAHGGSIVNLSSVSGIIGGHNVVAYNASKGAVRLLTKSVALHCARQGYGIRCNSVHPAFVETPMVDRMLQTTADPGRTRERLAAGVPLGRFGTPDEIADLIVYLASDESQFVTGAEFVIDGGMTAA
jgi:NAD(P)-dependent dehydrogenase (short-subunit alcohol dehydrogenase family)